MFFSRDKRFLVKEVGVKEFRVCLRLLPSYRAYVTREPHTLLQRVVQLASIKMRAPPPPCPPRGPPAHLAHPSLAPASSFPSPALACIAA